MGLVAGVLASVFAAYLVFVAPFLGRRRYQHLEAAVDHDPRARMHHYRRSIVQAWSGVVIVALIGALASAAGHSFALDRADRSQVTRSSAVSAAVFVTILLLVTILVLAAKRRHPKLQRIVDRQAKGFWALFPTTPEERTWFVGVAISAGICEEVVFRGFGIVFVRWLWPGISDPTLIVVLAVVFGVVHLYQGPRNVLLTGFLGGYFAWFTVATGSLVPAMIVHSLVDLRVLVLPIPTRAKPPPEPAAPT